MTSPALTLQFSALRHPLIPTSYSFTSKSRTCYNEPTVPMPEYEQELPENIMPRILQIEDLISTQRATMMEDMRVGWLYGGDELSEELEAIVEGLREEGGFDVIKCNLFHFAQHLNIKNPTNRLIIIPVNGTPVLRPGGRLLPGMFYYIEDARVLLLSEGVDVIFVGLARQVNGVEHGHGA